MHPIQPWLGSQRRRKRDVESGQEHDVYAAWSTTLRRGVAQQYRIPDGDGMYGDGIATGIKLGPGLGGHDDGQESEWIIST